METQCYDPFSYGREEEAFRLLKQVEDPRTVKNKNNFTLLHFAAHYGWLDIVKGLITEHQFNPECEDKDGNTPLSKARSNGKQHVVDYLEKMIGTIVVYLCFCTYSIIKLFLVFCVPHHIFKSYKNYQDIWTSCINDNTYNPLVFKMFAVHHP